MEINSPLGRPVGACVSQLLSLKTNNYQWVAMFNVFVREEINSLDKSLLAYV